MLEAVKRALPITTDAYDQRIEELIAAAYLDLGLAGVAPEDPQSALVRQAVITYCKLHFGDAADGEYDRLKASYDEQKAQMSMASGYTDWGAGHVAV